MTYAAQSSEYLAANEREYLEECAHATIGAAFEVSNVLGTGFLEKVYENALAIELKQRGFKSINKKRLTCITKAKAPVYISPI